MTALMEYAETFTDTMAPLPESLQGHALRRAGLTVHVGINEQVAQQLVEASKQPHVVAFCPNDESSRFNDVDAVRAWQAKGRLSLPLLNEDGRLTGFGWMGPGVPGEEELTIPGAKTTFAVRLYESGLGRRLSEPYVKTILAGHGDLYGNDGVWLETWLRNEAAIRSYTRAGFRPVGVLAIPENAGRGYRQYMTLGKLAVPASS